MKRFVNIVWLVVLGIIVIATQGTVAQQSATSISEVAKLLPQDSLAYIGLNDFQDGYKNFKTFLANIIGKEKAAEKETELKETIKAWLKYLPEKVSQHIIEGIKELQSVNAVLLDFGEDDIKAVAIVEATKEGVFTPLFEDFKASLEAPIEFEKVNIYRLPATEKYKPIHQFYFAAFGKYGLVATHFDLAKDVITRFTKPKEVKTSLADNTYFQKIIKTQKAGISFNAFADINKIVQTFVSCMDRGDRVDFDKVSAVLGLFKIKAFTLATRLDEDKKVVTDGALHFDKGCTIYDFIRQSPQEKEILGLIPAKNTFATVWSLENTSELWKKIRTWIKNNYSAFDMEKEEDFEKGLEKAKKGMGISIDEMADAIGNEVGFYLGDIMLMAIMGGQPPGEWAFIIEGKDKEKLASTWEKFKEGKVFIREFVAGRETKEKKYKDFTVYYCEAKERTMGFSYALVDKFLVLSGSRKEVEKVIDAYKEDKKSIAKDEAIQKILSKLPVKNSSFYMVNIKKIWQLLEMAWMTMAAGGEIPPFQLPLSSKDMPDDLVDIHVTVNKETELAFQSYGTGILTNLVFLSIPWVAIAIPVLRGSWGEPPKPPAGSKEEIVIPGFKVPEKKEELDKLIQELVKELGDDDPDKRESAEKKLKVIGEPAVPAVKKAARSKDEEVKCRAKEVLKYLRIYDATPAILEEKVDELVGKLTSREEQLGLGHPSASWNNADTKTHRIYGYYLEPSNPYWYDYPNLKGEDLLILQSDSGIAKFAEALQNDNVNNNVKKNIAYLLTQFNAKAGAKTLLDVYDKAVDNEVRLMALVALGWSSDKEAKEAIEKALKGDLGIGKQRAAFLAVERTEDTSFIPELIKLLASDDVEVRFSANYDLGKLTNSAVYFNVWDVKEDRANSIKNHEDWWKASEKTFKIKQKKCYLKGWE